MTAQRTEPIRFHTRALVLPKDLEHPEQNEDAYRLDPQRGIAAIADGVASSLFSRQWAHLLTEAAIAAPPDPRNREEFGNWLASRREAWNASIDVSDLAWFQKAKLPNGAFSTLLWIEVTPLEPDRRPDDPWQLRGFAVGDTCLLHVRENELLRTFPVTNVEEFETSPVVIGSVDLHRDTLVVFQSFDEYCRPGDLLVLCTDAVADWALRLRDDGNLPAWDDYWTKPDADWAEEVLTLRDGRQMRVDDTTLLLLRIADGTASPTPAVDTTPAPEAIAAPELPAAWARPEEWPQKLRSLSEQVSDGLSRGVEKLKEATRSAESTLRRVREKLRAGDDPPDDTTSDDTTHSSE